MALRWGTAGTIETDHQSRRVNGHLHMPKLRNAPNASFTENVTSTRQDPASDSLMINGAAPRFNGTRDNLLG